MNRDIQIPDGSDYVLRLELLGENNTEYEFEEEDTLHIIFSDIKGTIVQDEEIDISTFENPLSYTITAEFLAQFTADPVKYKIILYKEDITLTLLSGSLYR